MSLTLIAPPAEEPVTVSEFKDYIKIDGAEDDAMLAGLVVAARQTIEARFSVAIIAQTWRLALDHAPKEPLILPLAPVLSVDSVGLRRGGVIEALAPGAYDAEAGLTGRVALSSAVAPSARLGGLVVSFTAGWPDRAAAPGGVKLGVKRLAAHYYENREAGDEARGLAALAELSALFAPYRQVRL